MKPVNRRHFLKSLAAAPIGFALLPNGAKGMDCEVQHPIMPPNSQYEGQCPVCGMVRSMWARTWITFDEVKNVSQVCSFHCLADWILKSGQEATKCPSINGQFARYLRYAKNFILFITTICLW
jgi:copper chaperone NosL